jgi:maleylpyruvate isomerase
MVRSSCPKRAGVSHPKRVDIKGTIGCYMMTTGVANASPVPTERWVTLARESHGRFYDTVRALAPDAFALPSLLPGWTVGHVVAHVARNADSHTRRLRGALAGEEVARYPGGPAQRKRDIEEGSLRPPGEAVSDLLRANRELESTWERCAAQAWPGADLFAGDTWPVTDSPVRRLREVEMHHVDMGLGYSVDSWPAEYVGWELPQLLATVPGRVASSADARSLVAWLAGRSALPEDFRLAAW